MGNLHLPQTRFEEDALQSSSRVSVVASAQNLAHLANTLASSILPGLRLEPLDPSAPVPDFMLRDASVLIIEVDPDNSASMQRVGDIRSRMPDLPLVAAIDGATVSLVRTLVKQGISDVVSLPLEVEEVVQVSLDVAARRQSAPAQPQRLAPLISVIRSIGGCGATSIATQLAADLADYNPGGKGAVIADLDLQCGSVADYLGITARGDVADLLKAGDRLDEELIASVLGQTSSGLSVLCAPKDIMPLESVDSAQLLKLIQMLRKDFGYVVLDFPPDWTNWGLSAAAASGLIILVVELSISSLRQARRRLDLLHSVGVESHSIEIVVNRVQSRLFRTIDLNDVSETLGHSILGSVALDAPLVSTAQNQGQLVSDVREKSKFCKDINQISQQLRERLSAKGD